MKRTVAVVLKGYPRLSETFIAQEILALERAGLDLILVSLRYPTDTRRHPVHDEIRAPVSYLPEYLYREPLRVLNAWRAVRRQPGYRAARRQFIRDLWRDPTPNRVRRFGQALVLAAELPAGVGRIYSHFIHTPGSVARYASLVTRLPWCCSAHAKDIWTTPGWEISEKLAAADWTVTCTRAGARQLKSLASDPASVRLVYHGLDLSRFPIPASLGSSRDGGAPDDPLRLVTVGRAVEKKGFDIMLAALARLPDDFNWRATHIGSGPLLPDLKAEALRLGLGDRVAFRGSAPQTEVLESYRAADLFVLPCRIAADGDRDGLPNVILEAQSQGLACISTPVSGIPELIEDGINGVLVPSENADAVCEAILHLGRDPASRRLIGRVAADRVRAAFDSRDAVVTLLDLFGAGRLTREPVLVAEA